MKCLRSVIAAMLPFGAVLALVGHQWIRAADRAIPDAALDGWTIWGADARLIIWILTWVARTLGAAPGRLFDPPVGYPAPGALTGSDHFLASQLLFGPAYALTGNPVLAANVATLASYVLGGAAMFALLRVWGVHPLGALAGGFANMLGPLQTPSDLHVLQYPSWCLPLFVLAAERVVERPAGPRIAALSAVLAVVLLASYQIVANVALLGVMLVARQLARGRVGVRPAAALSLGALPPLALLAGVSVPYVRRLGEPAYALMAADHGWWDAASAFWRHIAWRELRWSVFALALLGLAGRRWLGPDARRARAVGTMAAVAGLVMAAGWTVRVGGVSFPLPFALFRLPVVPLRFLVLAGTGLAILCACGIEVARRATINRLRDGRAALAVASGLAALVGIETARAFGPRPLAVLPVGERVPAVYRWLREHAEGPLAEVPGYPRAAATGQNELAQAEAMYASLLHGLPILNLYTNNIPPGSRLVLETLDRAPDEDALQALVDMTGVRWILVHRDRVPVPVLTRWTRLDVPGIVRVGEFEDVLLYRVDRTPRFAWRAALSLPPREDVTLLGTPLARIGTPAANVHPTLPENPMRASHTLPLEVRIRNEGATSWPVAVPRGAPDEGVVRVEVRWLGPSPYTSVIPLPYDVEPGQEIRLVAGLATPPVEGVYEMRWGIAQGDRFFETGRAAGRRITP